MKKIFKIIILISVLFNTLNLVNAKEFSKEITPFVYNSNFIDFFNYSLKQAEAKINLPKRFVITELKEIDKKFLERDYAIAKTIRISTGYYGLVMRFDENNVIEYIQLSLHDSKVTEYKSFIQLLAEMLQVDYNTFEKNLGFTKKVVIAESNPRATRPLSSNYRRLKGGYLYSHTYRQNNLFDLSIERKTGYTNVYQP